jgi:hypothetical protein
MGRHSHDDWGDGGEMKVEHLLTVTERVHVARIAAIIAFTLLCLGHGLGYTFFAPPAAQLPAALQALVDLAAVRRFLGAAAVPTFGSLWLLSAGLGLLTLLWDRAEGLFWLSVLGVFGLWGGAYMGGAFTVLQRSWLFGTFYLSVAAIAGACWLLLGLIDQLTHSVTRLTATLARHDPPADGPPPTGSA